MDENDKIFKELEAHLDSYLKEEKDDWLKFANITLEIANRSCYVIQQAKLAKLRARQKIDVKTGDYITKKEGDPYIYKPAFDKATDFLKSLEV